jgi:hypothetical protein
MAAIPFDVSTFRAMFPAFADDDKYSDQMLGMYYTQAGCYISNNDSPYVYLNGDCLALALNLMTAHLAYLNTLVTNGSVPGLVISAAIDMISTTLQAPPEKSQWQWWLNLSAYGQQLLGILQIKGVGGMYIGGRPERAAFRGAYGVF